ncbi:MULTISPECIES: DUF3995 domain-containing protein [Actinoalloteichus]|uniref:DUF3995 family protein n=1 Tax=Actinoalloteichus fjordicus TaxID=1612552 RepID=A0AAC9PQE0_9PSEU|nr:MULTISPECIES: DUF3995 domain-containing protein [Actinoalloteichus]APU12832.1 putative DUF3995 family protein [Actinoalloteichus fjordicus]APU18804.1 putative DUF3995 family protein [Actinoalloteichus sp. GBA129-24]
MWESGRGSRNDRPGSRPLSWAAAVTGLGHAAFSVYWGLGGTWLLDTVAGGAAVPTEANSAFLALLVWAAALIKIGVAVAPLVLLYVELPGLLRRVGRLLSWVACTVLTLYGAVFTGAALLVLGGVIPAGPEVDRTALAWHGLLWDPWFLGWGVLLGAALWRTRGERAAV